jgi:hypothetical protein
VKAIADDEGVQSIIGRDPVVTGQLARDELAKGELTRITGSGSPNQILCCLPKRVRALAI